MTIEDSAIMPEAFFAAVGDSYVPGPLTQGPWGAAMGGQIVGGLLGWGIEQSGIDADFQPARLTVDLLRPVLLRPVQIQTSIQREGRRIKLVDAALIQRGTVVARASALFLRRGDHPEGQVWSFPVQMPALPTSYDGFPTDMPFLIWGYGATFEGSPGIAAGEWEQSHSQKFAWARVFRPMVQGYPLTPFTRLAFVGDITSSLTHWGTGGLRYINADYTVTASRLPDGEFVGLAAQSHYGTAGVATGAATLFDCHGPIGTSSALAVAQPADAFKPTHT
ncbi:thioesterase family protein [Mycobacterium montefiorense]|nr:thioesterase family protein [Mycobacterium montefiorense]